MRQDVGLAFPRKELPLLLFFFWDHTEGLHVYYQGRKLLQFKRESLYNLNRDFTYGETT